MPEAKPSRFQRFHAGFLSFCKHPASILVWFCLISLVIKEQYPFSHFPMYSGWSDRTDYYYVTDKNGPVQAKTVFRVSVPRIKKLYKNEIKDFLKEQRKKPGNKDYELTPADYAETGRILLENLRTNVPKKRLEKKVKDWEGNPERHPDGEPVLVKEVIARDLTLVKVDIRREGSQFIREESQVVTTSGDNQIVPKQDLAP